MGSGALRISASQGVHTYPLTPHCFRFSRNLGKFVNEFEIEKFISVKVCIFLIYKIDTDSNNNITGIRCKNIIVYIYI